MSWAYFLSVTIASNKIDTILMDFFILLFIFIYLAKCSFWAVQNQFKVHFSEETNQLLDQYMKDFASNIYLTASN